MMGVITGLITLLGSMMARFLTIETLKFIATKLLIIGAFTLILPVVLYNVFTGILSEIMTLTSQYVSASGVTGSMVQLTGMGGWIATQINLPGCFSIFLSAVALRYVLSFMRL